MSVNIKVSDGVLLLEHRRLAQRWVAYSFSWLQQLFMEIEVFDRTGLAR